MSGQARPCGYRLDGHHIPIPLFNLLEVALWWSFNDCTVARDECDEWTVSTVFLPPNGLFETAVFVEGEGGDFKVMQRYRTWAEAVAGHALVRAAFAAELESAGASALSILQKFERVS